MMVHLYICTFDSAHDSPPKNCSQIIEVHVHATVFSKVQPACHNIANGIN